MYKIRRVSPSSLAATEKCPRFRPDGKDNAASLDGTAFHEAMEKLMPLPVDTWEREVASMTDLTPDLRGLVLSAVEAVRPIAFPPEALAAPEKYKVYLNARLRMRGGKPRVSKLAPGVYPEVEIDRGDGAHGYIDLMVVTLEGLVYIIDYKSNRVSKDFRLQLAAYACDVNRLCPAHDAFVCVVIAPRLGDEDQLQMELGLSDLEAYRRRIGEIELRADWSANDSSIFGCPGEQCQFCRYNGKCMYQAADAAAVVDYVPTAARLVSRGVYEGERVTPDTFRSPATPKQRGLRRALLKNLEAMIEAMKDGDREWVRLNPGTEVPGWKVSFAAGRSSVDKSKMGDVRKALMSRFGLSPEEVLEVSVVDTSLLEADLNRKCGYTKKAAAEEVKRCLAPFSKPGSPVLRWTQERDPASEVDAEFVDAKPKEAIGN